MPVQYYTTRSLLEVITKIKPPTTFLTDLFFRGEKYFDTEEVLIDYEKEGEMVAPFVAPMTKGITIERDGYKTKKITAPRLAPQRNMRIEDLDHRFAGEDFSSKKTPQERQNELTLKDYADLEKMNIRAKELMVSQVLFDGEVIVRGYTSDERSKFVEQVIRYEHDLQITLLGDDKWGGAKAGIMKDISNAQRQVATKSGKVPDVIVMGSDAYEVAMEDEKFMKKLDNRRVNLGTIEPKFVDSTVKLVGEIEQMQVYVYYGQYQETHDLDGKKLDTPVMRPFVPGNKVLVAVSGIHQYGYGVVTQMEKDENFKTYKAKSVPKIIADVANDVKLLRLTSRPVPMVKDVDTWAVLTVMDEVI